MKVSNLNNATNVNRTRDRISNIVMNVNNALKAMIIIVELLEHASVILISNISYTL